MSGRDKQSVVKAERPNRARDSLGDAGPVRQDSTEVNKDILAALSTFIEEEEARGPVLSKVGKSSSSSAAEAPDLRPASDREGPMKSGRSKSLKGTVGDEPSWTKGTQQKRSMRVGKRSGSVADAENVGRMATVRGMPSPTGHSLLPVIPSLSLPSSSSGGGVGDDELPFDIPNLNIPISARITASTYVKGTRDAKLRQELLQMSHDQLLDHVMFMQWQAENKDKLISKYRQQVEALQQELRDVCRRTGVKSSLQTRDFPTVHLLDQQSEDDDDDDDDDSDDDSDSDGDSDRGNTDADDSLESGHSVSKDGGRAEKTMGGGRRKSSVKMEDEEEEEEIDIDKQLDDFIDAHEGAIVASSSEFSINIRGSASSNSLASPSRARSAVVERKASDLWHMPVDTKSPALLRKRLESEKGPLGQLVEETVGYYIEDGMRPVAITQHFALQNCTFYQEDFFNRPHENLMAKESVLGPVIASISKDGSSKHRVLLRTRKGDEQHIVEKQKVEKLTWKSLSHKVLKAAAPELGSCKWSTVNNPNLSLELIEFENRTVVKQFKIGALLAHQGQRKEEEMFANRGGDPLWEEFLEFLGQRVELRGWGHFSAGLDTKSDTTGKESVYTQWHSNELMFHVSTLLPFSPNDPQQVERKRHIGNDIVMLVFLTGDTPYKPTTISSNFIHVTLVVRPHELSADGTSASSYHLQVVAKDSVEPFGPALPERPVFARGAKFHDFLCAKMINAELSCYRSEKFVKKLQHARETYLRTIMGAYLK